MAKTDFKSVSEYIASKRKDVQAVLKLVRDAIRKAVPEAEELISYQMPVYRLNGGPVLYFAGWKQHYSLYPLGDAVAAEFQKELAAYEMSRGTIRLPLSEPVPVKLIQRIAKFRAKQLTACQKAKGSRKKGHETQLETGTPDLRHDAGCFRKAVARLPHVFCPEGQRRVHDIQGKSPRRRLFRRVAAGARRSSIRADRRCAGNVF